MRDEKAGTPERLPGSGRSPDGLRSGRRRRAARAIAAGLVALALLSLLRRARQPPESGPRLQERAAVDPWSLPGCYALRVERWQPEVQGEASPTPLSGTESRTTLLTPPVRVMLVPDSIDSLRRPETTYRAVPLGEGHDVRLDRYLRWFVRADTVWILWSDGTTGAVVALRASGDTLTGRARAFSFPDLVDATARASAHKINCWSLKREISRSGPVP